MAKKEKLNFLDIVPKKNEKIRWISLDSQIVQIQIDRNSWLDKAVRLFFKTPAMMKIDLDQYGSFIWNAIDGKKDFGAISEEFKIQFGDAVEPLYERMGSYANILRNNSFIKFDTKA